MYATKITDEALIKDYSERRNQEAFLVVYNRYQKRVAQAILSQLISYQMVLQDVDDIVQSVFVDLHNTCDRFDPTLPSSSVRAFLFKQASRRTCDYRRRCHAKQRDTRHLRHGAWLEEACDDPRSFAESKRHTTILIQEMLVSLPDDEEEALRLTWLEGHTYPSVAKLLNLPLTTVEFRIRSALEHLRELFAA